MRIRLLAVCLLMVAAVSAPAITMAQAVSKTEAEKLDARLGKLESEVKAVQRKVFPGGSPKYFEPEFPQTQPQPQTPAPGATNPVADLQGRVDMLEQQLANMTGQVEQATFRARQAEEQLAKLKADLELRLNALETTNSAASAGTPPAPNAGVQSKSTATTAPSKGSTAAVPAKAGEAKPFPPVPTSGEAAGATDSVEAQYRSAYAYVSQKDYDRAEAALKTFLQKNPSVSRTSHAQYWLGRTYMARNSYAQAAKAFLDGYRDQPQGDRAPDSLLWLGEALVGLNKPDEACRAYNELQAAYPKKITGELKTKLEQGRVKAKCG